MIGHRRLGSAEIRAKLSHPGVDADGHMIEARMNPDFLKARWSKMRLRSSKSRSDLVPNTGRRR